MKLWHSLWEEMFRRWKSLIWRDSTIKSTLNLQETGNWILSSDHSIDASETAGDIGDNDAVCKGDHYVGDCLGITWNQQLGCRFIVYLCKEKYCQYKCPLQVFTNRHRVQSEGKIYLWKRSQLKYLTQMKIVKSVKLNQNK